MSNEIFVTQDYHIFKKLNGNREVSETHVQKIVKSVENIGVIPAPIIVNEKMEVIDGQGRLKAFERLGKPVHYIIVDGIGMRECQFMNMNQTNWKTEDYIKSYNMQGKPSYIKLYQLYKKYDKLGARVVCTIANGTYAIDLKMIREGRFKITDEEFLHVAKKLDYLMSMNDVVKQIKGRIELYFYSLAFAYDHAEVDNKRMKQMVTDYHQLLPPAATILQSLDALSELYNRKLQKGKVYLKADYQRYMDAHYVWYKDKWGDKNENPS